MNTVGWIAVVLVAIAGLVWLSRSGRDPGERVAGSASSVLAEALCPACGIAYGLVAAQAAEREYNESLEAMGAREFYPDPHWSIVCPGCGADARFHWLKHELSLGSA